jgi:type IX secretion system PorP/SprF family membrane protein
MNMKKLFITVYMLCITALGLYAQQDATYNLYMFNGLYLNPAYAGSHEVADLMGIYRHQWAGVNGAPYSGNVSFHAPFRRNQYALGATVFAEHIGLMTSVNATVPFSYRIRAGKVKICLGIQPSVSYFSRDNSGAIPDIYKTNANYNDYIFNGTNSTSRIIPNFGAGIYVYSKRFYAGFSVPHILPLRLSDQSASAKNYAKQYNNYILTAGVVIGRERAQ